MTRDDLINIQDLINQLGESHDFVTHLVNKYATCDHNAQIRCQYLVNNTSR